MEPIHNAPDRAKNLDWATLARSAMRDLLQSRKLDEFLGRSSTKKKSDAWRVQFEDDQKRPQTNCAADINSKALTRLRLPWMPKEPVVAELLAIASLAAALGSKSAVARLLDPGQLIHLVMPLVEEDVGDVSDAVRGALSIWTGRNLDAEDEKVALKIYVNFDVSDRSSKTSSSGKQLRSRIEGHLRAGMSVLLVTPNGDVPEALQRHICRTVRCPSLTPAIAVEVTRALHRKAARLGPERILDRLPSGNRLQRLSGTQFEATLRLTDPDAMFARLMRQTEVQPISGGATLKKVKGQREAVGHLNRMLFDLQLWQAGGLDWSRATMSAVLFGPPGNGKTMLAQAFAGSAGIPLHVTSYADCQRHGHQGDMLKAMYEAFKNAEAAVPCVLFIDEIDSFSSRSRGSENQDYMRGVVNGLLMHLSRASATPGLVLLAATNDLSVVDPAVIRPGRFDLRIPVLHPDRRGVQDILADNLTIDGSMLLTEAELDAISIELVGASGATVAAAAREALSRARAAGRALILDDLRAVVQTRRPAVNADYLRRLAVHEAGHVIVRALSSLPPPHTVRIGEGGAAVASHGLPFLTPQTADEVLQELLAGRAAERVVLGQISSGAGEGAASDLAQATSLALKMETEWSFSPGAKVWQPASALMMLNLPPALKATVEERLAAAEQAAETCLRQHRDALLRLTDLLLEKREITGQDLVAVLSDLGLRKERDTHVSVARG